MCAQQAPISGFQVDFDVDGSNEALPDEVVGGQVIIDAGYSIVFGGSAAVAFAFDLSEISASESPVRLLGNKKGDVNTSLKTR